MAIAGTAAISAASVALADGPEVPFPLGYRHWVHISSGWVGEGSPAFPHFAGLHHIYANPAAMKGYAGGTFPKGSVIVFDVLATKAGTGSLTTAERRLRDVMEKTDAGWRFTEFNADSRTERSVTTAAGDKACGACHASAKQDHVFSTFTETD
jgi:hypothetical protein